MYKVSIYLFVFLIALSVNALAQQFVNPIFKTGDRVCFVGNSITHNGEFHHNILQYYITRYPNQKISFFNAGIKGNITSDVLERLNTDILVNKPTHCVIMLGMNDVQQKLYSKTLTINKDTLQKQNEAIELYSKNLNNLVEIFLKNNIKVILQKPSAYDQTSKLAYPNKLGVNDALIKCGLVIQKIADKYKLRTVDYTSITTKITNQIQAKNNKATLTVNDRVHPNNIGHFIMTHQFLKTIENNATVAKIIVDVKNISEKKLIKNCTISNVKYNNNNLSLDVFENSLPFPTTNLQQDALSIVPFMKDLNNETLQIKNLKEGHYLLLIDSINIANFSKNELEEGVNLANYPQTPQYKQSLTVSSKLQQLWENESTLRSIAFVKNVYLKNYNEIGNNNALKKYLDSIYANQYKGQMYYSNAFQKYITYNEQTDKLLKVADSLRNVIYNLSQTVTHNFIIKKINEPTTEALIEASQSGAAPLLFKVQHSYLVKDVANFKAENEFFLRNGLPNFFTKLQKNKSNVTVGFLGGSITKAENQYRNQTLAYIQTINPSANIVGVNAGVSGTGTELGACRVAEQILQYNPDLVFVEFAVNGGSNQAMEGIVRQIQKYNSKTDICFIYTIAGEQYKQYAKNEVPAKIQGFEKVADHYKIPSIHLGLYPSILELEKKLLWKSNKEENDKIIFSKDGTHPLKAGGDLYTQAIMRAFEVFKNKASISQIEKPIALYTDNWEDGKMYSPIAIGEFSNGWENIDPLKDSSLKGFAPWFSTIAKTAVPNASFTFKFNGTSFGFFDIGGPEVGQILIEVDGICTPLKRKVGNSSNSINVQNEIVCINNRFNSNCNNRYRGQFEMFEVTDGEHEVKITLSNIKTDKISILKDQDLKDIQQNPAKYDKQVFYLGKILVKGNIVKQN